MHQRDLQKLRDRGLLESSSSGAECVRLSVQYTPRLAEKTREERRQVLSCWADRLREALAPHGAEIVPDSLSLTAQTLEAKVPVEEYPDVESKLADAGGRVDMVVPRQVVSAG